MSSSDPKKKPGGLSYEQLKAAVQDEQEFMKLMLQLPPQEFDKLMNATAAWAASRAKESEATIATAQVARREADNKAWLENEQLKREAEQKKQDSIAAMQREKAELDTLAKKKEFELEQQRLENELKRQKELVEHQVKTHFELKQKMAPQRLQARIEEQTKLREVLKERAEAVEKIRSDTDLKIAKAKYDMMLNYFSGAEGVARATTIGGLVAASIFSLYSIRAGTTLATKGLERYFFKPKLVSSLYQRRRWHAFVPGMRKRNNPFGNVKVVMNPSLAERLNRIRDATINVSKRGGYFGHLLLHGKPGCGKTLWASKLACESGMDFAIMSGSAFDQFKPGEAVTEVKNLFAWANSRPRGVLLLLDECEAFLESRDTLSPKRVQVLNEFLAQTGTESKKFMLVFATNRPNVLDPAILTRVVASVEIPLPSEDEIKALLNQYIDRYLLKEAAKSVGKPLKCKILTQATISSVAKTMALNKFAGRDITSYVISLTSAAVASPNFTLDEDTFATVLTEQIAKRQAEEQYELWRAKRQHAMHAVHDVVSAAGGSHLDH